MTTKLKPVNFYQILGDRKVHTTLKDYAANFLYIECKERKYDLYTNLTVTLRYKSKEYFFRYKVTKLPSENIGYQLTFVNRKK